jgi:hypothetical protein
MLVVDGGVENFNGDVDKLIESGLLRRVLAMTEIEFSNSLIEAFWRTMKHQPGSERFRSRLTEYTRRPPSARRP